MGKKYNNYYYLKKNINLIENFNLSGPQGPDGNRGYEGPRGLQGIQGPRGDIGPEGRQGDIGPIGYRGPAGNSGIKGTKGPKGIIGPKGLQGFIGQKGFFGKKGPKGKMGKAGLKGYEGLYGFKGFDGPSGSIGKQGLSFAKYKDQSDMIEKITNITSSYKPNPLKTSLNYYEGSPFIRNPITGKKKQYHYFNTNTTLRCPINSFVSGFNLSSQIINNNTNINFECHKIK